MKHCCGNFAPSKDDNDDSDQKIVIIWIIHDYKNFGDNIVVYPEISYIWSNCYIIVYYNEIANTNKTYTTDH